MITNEFAVKWYLFWDALTEHRTDGALVRIIIPLSPTTQAADADRQLLDFVSRAAPELPRFRPRVRLQYILPFIVAMVVAMACACRCWPNSHAKWGIVDQPGGRKVHAAPIPRIGGIAMAIGGIRRRRDGDRSAGAGPLVLVGGGRTGRLRRSG